MWTAGSLTLSPLEKMLPQPLPRDADGPAFAEPWQAQAFALALVLSQRGVFTWPEWTEALAAEIRLNPHLDDGCHYYDLWLSALEKLVARKHLVDNIELDERTSAWRQAALATPHGQPVELPKRRETGERL